MRRWQRSSMQLVCILLLLGAQQSALAHQIGHVRHDLSAGQQDSDDRGRATHSALCDYHGALAEVLGFIGPAASQLPLAVDAPERHAGCAPAASPLNAVPPAARGPPVLA